MEIEHSNLPAQQAFTIDTRKIPKNTSHHEAEDEDADLVQRLFATNELRVSYAEMRSGQEFARHTHTPDLYQIYLPVEGRLGISYINNEGEERFGTAEAGEALYLPPGADNKLSNAGDGRLRFFAADNAKLVSRIGQVIKGEADTQYDPQDASHLLRLDPYRGDIFEMDEKTVSRF